MDHSKNKGVEYKAGFTLLETLIVLAIVSILAAVSFGIYTTLVSSVQFSAAHEDILSDLKTARESAMSGLYSDNWGIEYTNTGSSYYYQIFYTPTTYSSGSTVTTTLVYLPSGVFFTNPASNSSSTIMFTNTTGTTTTSTVGISDNYNDSSTITVTPSGTIY